MAKPKTADSDVPESAPEPAKPTRDGRARVRAYDTVTGKILGHLVPAAWLDGRFPNLKETPSSKVGS